jgi:diacylglycerol kinase
MPFRQWIRSANNAIEGILHAARTQRHLRYHFFSAAAVLIISYILGVSRIEFLIIALSVLAVLLAEMFNTAVEAIVDIVSPEQSEKARIAKDVAAGAVLIAAFGVAVIGYIVLFPYRRHHRTEQVDNKSAHSMGGHPRKSYGSYSHFFIVPDIFIIGELQTFSGIADGTATLFVSYQYDKGPGKCQQAQRD